MLSLFTVVRGIVSVLLGALQLFMFLRAIISWFPVDEDGPLVSFLYAATEPFIMPVRALLERSELFASSPIDVSFFITFLLISLLQTIL